MGAFFNGVFPSSPPGDPSGWAVENAFPNLTFTDPMMMSEIPGTNEFLVVGKTGLMWRFPKNPGATMAQRVQVLDLTAATETSEDQGFYSLAFHPNFATAPADAKYVYVCYSRRAFAGVDDNNRTYWTVSRFKWLPGGTIDSNSEYVLISQYDPHRYHNGGATFFGDDGFLYITVGDGGDGGDSFNNSQRINVGLFGGILRIDVNYQPGSTVSHAIRRQPTEDSNWEMNPKPEEWPDSYSQGYGIPNDNPWLNTNGSILEEFYAIGLRSPHSAHFDPVTDEIWVGDVGQSNREELTRVPKGGNCQWAYKEGNRDTSKNKPSPLTGTEVVPVHEYDHSEGASIIGGMRYRGSKPQFSSLIGKVIFGDHVRGRIWSLELTGGSNPPVVNEMFSTFHTGYKGGLSNFSTDSTGEIYMMDLAGSGNPTGKIMKIAVPAVSPDPPQFLSQTGVFTNLETLATAPGVIPYHVPSGLWSDNAEKQRWIIAPNDGSFNSAAEDVVFSAEEDWVFPAGTVFVKHFEVPLSAGNPAVTKRLETRFLICTTGGGKYGITYKWNNAGTEAELQEAGSSDTYNFSTGSGTEVRTWDFPSRGDCMVCHNETAGQALGVRTVHLNSKTFYPATGRTANQLETFNSLGLFDVTLTTTQLADFIEARALDDSSAPLEHRMRSYLDTNCSHCHQPGAQGDGFDARLGTPLNLQNLINSIPTRYEELGPDGRYIKPGNAALSALYVRANAVGNGDAMPPLAKNMAHAAGVAVLEDYIENLTDAEFAPPLGAGPQARYVRLKSIDGKSRFAAVAEFSILNGNGIAIPASQVTASYLREDPLNPGSFVAGTSASGAPPSEATDGDPGSSTNFWQSYKAPSGQPNSATPNHPHYLLFDLQSVQEIGGFKYYPRTAEDGRIYQYLVQYSANGTSWTTFDSGVWGNVATPYEFKPGYNKRPARCHIAGPAQSLPKPFDMTVVFDMDATGFTPADLQVTGGSVTALRGSGYYYVARISPAPGATSVSVGVSQDAVSPEGKGSFAATTLPVTIIPDTGAPDSPPALAANPHLLAISLSWDESPDNVATTGYEIRRNGTLLATVTGTTYEDTGLECNTPYSYTVVARDAALNSSTPAVVSTATLPDTRAPDAPLNLAGTSFVSSIQLSWTDPGDNVGVDEYQIWRNGTVIATVQSTGYLDSGLEPNTSFDYAVVALDEATNASPAATLSVATLPDIVAPLAPGALSGVPSLLSVQLSWEASTDLVGVVGYRIRRGNVILATISGLTYADTGLDCETPYDYHVIALDEAGNESEEASLTVTTLPDEDAPEVPEDFTATPFLQQVQLSWSASNDNVAVTGYRIVRNGTTVATVQSLSHLDTGLVPETLYNYQVFALDGSDNAAGTTILPVTTLEDESPPDTPADLSATRQLHSISLTWTAAGDNVTVTGYEVRRGPTLLATVTTPGYDDTGLEAGTPYAYSVTAVDAAENASVPATLNTSTLDDEDGPLVPTNLTGAPDYHSVELSWDAPWDNVAVIGYEIHRGATMFTTTGLSFVDTGLTDGTAYTYQVIAKDAAGNLSPAASVSITTLGLADWLGAHGLAGQSSTDSDHGGLDNLTEYYLGLDPNNPLDDLTFRIDVALTGPMATVAFPDLKPTGTYRLLMSGSLENLGTSVVHTVTPAQINAMTEAERADYEFEASPPPERAFFMLEFVPPAP